MSHTQMIRVLVVDDHHMVRKGLATYLKSNSDLLLVGEASNGEEALMVFDEVKPDVVLMDLIMPKLDGVAVTREILKRSPNTKVIALTSYQDKDLVQSALQGGAIGYLLKNVTGEDLAQAIRNAYNGKTTLAPEATRILIQATLEDHNPGEDLTPRELEVLKLLADGLTNPEIANSLSISRTTARAHVSHILGKLRVSNRSEAVALALRQKLVT